MTKAACAQRIGVGLYIRSVEGRPASFVLRYTAANGKRREMGLGIYDGASSERCIARAHQSAQDARDLLARGMDPIDAKHSKRDQKRVEALRSRGLTVLRLCRRYHERCVEPRVSTKYARDWIYRIEHDAPEWLLSLPVVDLRAVDVLIALREASVTQHRKDLLRQRIDQVCEWLIDSETLESNPAGVRRNTRPEWRARFDGAQAGVSAEGFGQ